MANTSKRMKSISDKFDKTKMYLAEEAIDLIKSVSAVKFVESFDIAVVLGIDPRKSDQAVRGASVLPHGTGKTMRVAVFAQGQNAEKAKAAGADAGQLDCGGSWRALRVCGRRQPGHFASHGR